MGAILLALLAAAGYGVSDFVGGVAARRVAALRVVLVSYPVSVLLLAVIALPVGGQPSLSSMLWGLAAGATAALAVWWFYLALASGPMSVISPITSVLAAGVPLAAGIAMGERPGRLAVVGAVLAVLAVLLVSREKAGGGSFTRRIGLLTVGSGGAFAVYFILLDQVPSGTGLWPLVISRVGASLVVVVAAVASGQVHAPSGVPLRLALVAGVLDVIANVAFLYAVQGGLLSLVSVIASLYPAATVALAMVVLGERVQRVQKAGMVLAAAAVTLIAVAG
ncbi:MAG: DMT family transporter [Mycobacteriaceae bacterium]